MQGLLQAGLQGLQCLQQAGHSSLQRPRLDCAPWRAGAWVPRPRARLSRGPPCCSAAVLQGCGAAGVYQGCAQVRDLVQTEREVLGWARAAPNMRRSAQLPDSRRAAPPSD